MTVLEFYAVIFFRELEANMMLSEEENQLSDRRSISYKRQWETFKRTQFDGLHWD